MHTTVFRKIEFVVTLYWCTYCIEILFKLSRHFVKWRAFQIDGLYYTVRQLSYGIIRILYIMHTVCTHVITLCTCCLPACLSFQVKLTLSNWKYCKSFRNFRTVYCLLHTLIDSDHGNYCKSVTVPFTVYFTWYCTVRWVQYNSPVQFLQKHGKKYACSTYSTYVHSPQSTGDFSPWLPTRLTDWLW